MSAYLYALLPGDAPLPDGLSAIRGVTDGPVRATPAGPFRLIHADHDGGEILESRRRMLAHARVLEALTAETTPLPMRFGLVAGDADAAAARFAAMDDRIAAEFDRIAGRIEMGLRISWPRDAALARLLEVDPGLAAARDRLAGRGAEAHFDRIELGRRVAEALDRRRGAAQRDLLARIAPLCADHVLRAPEEDVEALRMECLVPRDAEESLAAAAETAAAEADFAPAADPVVRLVGPVAPFNFVRLALDDGLEAA
jgi:hypothetical protein